MNKPTIWETVVLSLALVLIPLVTRAALFEDSKFVEGIVKVVADNTITLTTQSPDGAVTQEVAVKAEDSTIFNDVKLADLKEGDRIRVEYHEEQDIKAAEIISKVQP